MQSTLKNNKKKYMEKSGFIYNIKKYKTLYILLLPGIIFFLLFKYIPLYGLTIAFKNYKPWFGIFQSPWVGLTNFRLFTKSAYFWQILTNTFLISGYKLFFFFPIPLILALLLNEVKWTKFKRIVQTITYFPHFISWVVIFGLVYNLLNTQTGVINNILRSIGKEPIAFLIKRPLFRPMLVLTLIWKSTGWSSIVYLAALSGIDPQLYEAAKVDGANRWQQLINITLPSLFPIIAILFLLRVGRLLYEDFQQILIFMGNSSYLTPVGEVFETYVYRTGLLEGQFSLGTTVQFFQAIFGLLMVVVANYIATKKFNYRGLW